MPKRPFEVGDRVAAYNCTKRYEGVVWSIDNRRWPTTLVIETRDDVLSFHPKQCRRLVRKERRRVWVNMDHWDYYKADNPAHAYLEEPQDTPGWVEFIEVKKK